MNFFIAFVAIAVAAVARTQPPIDQTEREEIIEAIRKVIPELATVRPEVDQRIKANPSLYIPYLMDTTEIRKFLNEIPAHRHHNVFPYERLSLNCNQTKKSLAWLRQMLFEALNKMNFIHQIYTRLSRKVPSATTDSLPRSYWLKNHAMVNKNITFVTKGRIRIIMDQYRIRSVLPNQDQGVYTCVRIDPKTAGLWYEHHRITIQPYTSSWFNFMNPNALVRMSLLAAFLGFIIPVLWYRYKSFGYDQVRKRYKRMEASPSMIKEMLTFAE